MLRGLGNPDRVLTETEIRDVVAPALSEADLDRQRVLVIIPDRTRTAPIPLMFRILSEEISRRASRLDYLVALGTHQPLDEDGISALVGMDSDERESRYPEVHVFNHRWDLPETFVRVGTIPSAEIETITGGLMNQAVAVRLNRLVFEYDRIIICGPVFPHEVVGFSGGNKYFFPGIGGAEVINFSHWLGAVITSYAVIGTRYTPVRRVIDRAAAFINRPKLCLAMVVKEDGLAGLYAGTPEEAYDAAAELSARLHICWIDKPFDRVLSVMPAMYDEIWTAAKGMYKLEPAVADGGEVIVYAPHIEEISYTHGKLIDEIGYHVRDYFLKQWDKFKRYPGGVLAHSTHLRGKGEYDPATGIESARIRVTLATRIPEDRCRRLNLGYMNPDEIDLADWRDREQEGILLVPKAGEVLYRVRPVSAQALA